MTATVRALNLDVAQQQNFIRFYKTLEQKSSTSIRFFDRTDYYTLHGEDALLGAEIVFGSTGVVKVMGEEPNTLDYVCLSRANFETLLKELLLVKMYRVEVYVNQGSSKVNDWVVEYKGSPGNLSQFEDILFENNSTSIADGAIAVKYSVENSDKTVGIAFFNSNETFFEICEFVDDDCFSELEALVVRLGPKECLVQRGIASEITRVMERNDILVTERGNSDFSAENVLCDLDRLLRFREKQIRNAAALPEIKYTRAIGSISALIKYFELTADKENFNRYEIKVMDLKRCVRLDVAAVKALNLFPKIGHTGRAHSVFGLLDLCRTQQGRRLLSRWIKRPLRDLRIISERHDIVSAFVTDSETRSSLRDMHLRGIPDLPGVIKKLAKKKATLRDCFKLYKTISRFPSLLATLRSVNDGSVKSALAGPFGDLLSDVDKFQQMIDQTIDADAADKGEFLVKPSFDEELTDLHEKKMELEAEIQKVSRTAANDLDMEFGKTLKLESNPEHGYYFRITLKEEPTLRNKKKYHIIDAIKGGVRFTNDDLSNLNNDYKDICKSYESHQKGIVDEIVSIASGYADTISAVNEVIAKIDVLASFAEVVAISSGMYVRPKMHPEGFGELCLKKLRHPLVELQENISYIPNDVRFSRDGYTFLIITGPNMGGKSTLVRSVGVSLLLAHIGMFVPCTDATISVCDAILARIGANDDESKGMSTYMVELTEAAAIMKIATTNSFVMIDELGRGTSTREGCGFATATIEYIVEKNQSFTMFATHFPQLTELAEKYKTICNQHVAVVADEKEFTLLYKLENGPSFKSCGVQLARAKGFSEVVVRNAFKRLAKMDPTINLDDVPPTKIIAVVREGNHFIEDHIQQFKRRLNDIDQTASNESLLEIVREFQTAVKNHNNPYIEGFSKRSDKSKAIAIAK